MKNKDEQEKTGIIMLNWLQILMLIGRPLWDAKQRKWRILNGYQSVLGNNNNIFFEVTFTDTPLWEDFTQKELYVGIPTGKENKKNLEKNKDNEKNKPTKKKKE